MFCWNKDIGLIWGDINRQCKSICLLFAFDVTADRFMQT